MCKETGVHSTYTRTVFRTSGVRGNYTRAFNVGYFICTLKVVSSRSPTPSSSSALAQNNTSVIPLRGLVSRRFTRAPLRRTRARDINTSTAAKSWALRFVLAWEDLV